MILVVSSMILIGLALLIAEIVFIPGTTVVGVLGLVFIVIGIVFTYNHFGNEVGYYVLFGTVAVTALSLYWSFRKGAWNRFSLSTSIDGKINEGITSELAVEEEGITTSALRPVGSADFKGKIFEVKSAGDYIASGTKVKIVRIETNDILVEPIL
jgi:membrane-bound ClpP family serine protease